MHPLNEQDAKEKLNSSDNVLNRLRKPTTSSPKITSPNSEQVSPPVPVEPPSAECLPEPAQKPIKKLPCSVTVGTGPGTSFTSKRIDEETRLLCAALTKAVGCEKAAELTGVSYSTAAQLARCEKKDRDGNRKPDEELRERLYAVIPKIQDTALEKFYEAAGFVNKETLKHIPLKEQAHIASRIMYNMAVIAERITPKIPANTTINNTQNAQVIMSTAPSKKEEDYETVDAVAQRIA